jgi:uncharacterized protein
MKKLTQFLFLSFAFSIIGGLVIYFAHLMPNKALTGLGTVLVALFIMPAPAYSVLIIARFNFNKLMTDYGVVLSKEIIINTVKIAGIFVLSFSILMPLIVYLISLINPQLSHLSSATELNDALLNLLKTKGVTTSKVLGLQPIFLLLLSIIAGFFAGFTVNGLFAFGEELGWRGFMDKELAHFSFLKKNIIIGITWGLWHSPMILQGYNFPDNPLLGCVFMCLFCIAMSFVFSYAKQLTNSTITPSVLHGAFNGLAPSFVLLITTSNMLLGGILGLAGIVAILLTFLIIKLVMRPQLTPLSNTENH